MNTLTFSYSNTALFWVFDADRSVSKYDTRLGRRWNLDPKPNVSSSNYSTNANNPIWYKDWNGDKEFKNYSAYKKELGSDAIKKKDWNGQDGHWLTSDRKSSNKSWSNANTYNIKNNVKDQYEPYEQVGDFYNWVNDRAWEKGMM